ncbi:MAG: NAD(+) synthase [Balneolaceae bacterium]|nr:NAD(+) synthase [Balneolaceae bacterium]
MFEGTEFGVAEENMQSRIRGLLLMALANKYDYMLLNTGNKSEMATGYCTLYGDMNGGLGTINDVYKTEIYDMARWLNESYYDDEVIPLAVIEKPPSAELRPDQKTLTVFRNTMFLIPFSIIISKSSFQQKKLPSKDLILQQ